MVVDRAEQAVEVADQPALQPGDGLRVAPLGHPDEPPRPLAGHVGHGDHNAFFGSAAVTLNINRASMARYGFSPATRVFEAAGAAACLITDAWEGIELFLRPEEEVLVARSGRDVAEIVRTLSPERARLIGEASRRRVLMEHTYERRAALVNSVLSETVCYDVHALEIHA